MAVEIESQGQLQELLSVLARRKWQVILPALILISLGIAVAVMVPKKYVARTQIELRPVGVSISTKEASNAPLQLRSLSRVEKVVKSLQHREYLALPVEQRIDFLQDIIKDIKVTPIVGSTQATTFVSIEFADVNRDWAREFLLALREEWTKEVVDRDRRKIDSEAETLVGDRKRIEKDILRESAVLTDLRRENGISATQPVPGGESARTEDPIFTNLKQNETDHDRLERELATLQVRLAAQEKAYDERPQTIPREEVLKGTSNEEELKKLEVDILDIAEKLKGVLEAHHSYPILKREKEKLERKRDLLKTLVKENEVKTRSVPNPELPPLRRALEDLRRDVAERTAALASLKVVIERDQARVESLHDVYKTERTLQERIVRLNTTLTQLELELSKKQTEAAFLRSSLAVPFEVSEEVNVSTKPSEPNPWLILSFSIVVGLGLGLSIAIVLEFSRNSFRSVSDIARVLVVPVLGAIDGIVTEDERRRRRQRQAVVLVTSIAASGAILFVTWAWVFDPSLLSPGLRDSIEGVRSKFR